MRFIDYVKGRGRYLTCPYLNNAGLRITGYKTMEVYDSPKKQLEVARAIDEKFGTDFIFPLGRGTLTAESIGVKTICSDYDFPSVIEHPITDIESISKFKIPDPYADEKMLKSLETLRLLSSSFEQPVIEFVRGPFTLAVELTDATHFLKSIIKYPEFVNEVLKFTTEVVSRYVSAVSNTGVKMIMITEPSSIVLSPKRFEKLVAANLRKVLENVGPGIWKTMHICGDTTKLLDGMLSCGMDGLSLDQLVDIRAIADRFPDDVVIFGNLDPIEVLKNDTPEMIRDKTLEMLRSMADYENFVFSFGCDCRQDTPFENLKSAIDAGKAKLPSR